MLKLGVEQCSSVSPVCKYVMTVVSVKLCTNVMKFHWQSHALLLASRLSDKWPLVTLFRDVPTGTNENGTPTNQKWYSLFINWLQEPYYEL